MDILVNSLTNVCKTIAVVLMSGCVVWIICMVIAAISGGNDQY